MYIVLAISGEKHLPLVLDFRKISSELSAFVLTSVAGVHVFLTEQAASSGTLAVLNYL